MINGIIYKALSGFYYVSTDEGEITCRARGKFRREKKPPLVGDNVEITESAPGEGIIETILPRRNAFIRPPVANVDQMVIIASAALPVTDPFLIDRIALIAVLNNCEPVICINKCDLDPADDLRAIYENCGFKTVAVSAEDGTGIDDLRKLLENQTSVFTGNSGVGKSSILNRLSPDFNIITAEVSEKLGRGRHTTRHIELYRLSEGAYIADTPGFSSFDTDILKESIAPEIVKAYPEFSPYLDNCRFPDCAHVKEKGCAVIDAAKKGEISSVRHENYVRLYNMAMSVKDWETKL